MFERWTFGRKLTVAFAMACLALIVVAVVGYRSTEDLVDNAAAVAHTHQVRRDIADLLSLVQDVETGQRGFVITGDDSFLAPYRSALDDIAPRLRTLRKLTADNAEQQRRLDGLAPAIDGKLAEMAATIALRRTGGLEATAARISGGEGKRYMDQIRADLAAMDAAEARLLDQRRDRADASTAVTEGILLWGSAAAVALVVVIGWIITRSLSTQIGTAVRRVQSSATELQAAATQQAASAREQASAMTEIATTLNELLASSRQIAEAAQQVSTIADQTAVTVRTGDSTVDRGNTAVAEIRRQVDLVVGRMVELAAKSQEVGAVLDLVLELAEQTNILAINATIEAAGAGESGRRFAVVADEIRKLADRVTGSAREIGGLVTDVRGAVNATVMTTETGSKAVDAGARQFAEVASAFEAIAGRVVTTTDAAKEIGLSTKQQASAVEQVTAAISSVSEATRQTETSTEQTLQTAAELASLSRDLVRLVEAAA
jgi:methyl-accepting chemotaxis protein